MTELSTDLIYDILSSPRRRHVLEVLDDTDGEIEFAELATRVTAREEGGRGQVTSTKRQRRYVSIYQTHVPKLENVDVVTYEDGVVSTADEFDCVLDAMRAVEVSQVEQSFLKTFVTALRREVANA